MSLQALSLADVARELGRSPSWLYDHWPALVAEKKIPKPLIEKGGATWCAAQFYAFQDRDLTPAQRVAAAAYRAAVAAAEKTTRETIGDADEIAAARARLDKKFARDPVVAG